MLAQAMTTPLQYTNAAATTEAPQPKHGNRSTEAPKHRSIRVAGERLRFGRGERKRQR
jgi:hypothetical protein